jgi:hypothetical protein
MALILPTSNVNSPISADLMYRFYDNKAITPQIRAALQKRQDAEDAANAESGSSNPLNPGPAARVNITDQIIRMNIANNSTKKEEKTDSSETAATTAAEKKPSRYDVLEEVKKSVAARESAARAEKDAQLKEIADKVAASGGQNPNAPEGG